MGDQFNLTASSSFRSAPKFSFTASAVNKDLKPKNMPGPGQYIQTKAEKDKFTRTPSWSIGGSTRDSKSMSALPGPGAYTPADPSYVSPKWLFTTDSRLKANKRSLTPGPGAYTVKSTLEGQSVNICSKPECKALWTTPGPGSYQPSWEACSNVGSTPKVGFGASNRKQMVMSKTPGPGAYDQPTSLGGKAFSIKGRYEPPKAAVTPGPMAAGTTFK